MFLPDPTVKPLWGTQINRDHPLGRVIVADWLLNDGTGQLYQDTVQSHVVSSATSTLAWAGSGSGHCVDFGAGSKEIRITRKGTNLFPTSQGTVVTVFARVYCTNTTDGVIFSVGEFSDSNYAWTMTIKSGTLQLNNNGGWNSGATNIDSALTVTANTWQTMAIAQSASNARLFMVNGGVVSNTTALAAGSIATTDPYGIGMGYANAGSRTAESFKGKIARVALFGRALTAEELRQLYAEPYAMYAQSEISRFYSFRRVPVMDQRRRRAA